MTGYFKCVACGERYGACRCEETCAACGQTFSLLANGGLCPCHDAPRLTLAAGKSPATHAPAPEVAPGVFVARASDRRQFASSITAVAYGPGLDAALQCAADVATLDAWRKRGPEAKERRNWSIGGDACRLYAESIYVHTQVRPWAMRYEGADENAARRAAADAIRNGRVPA